MSTLSFTMQCRDITETRWKSLHDLVASLFRETIHQISSEWPEICSKMLQKKPFGLFLGHTVLPRRLAGGKILKIPKKDLNVCGNSSYCLNSTIKHSTRAQTAQQFHAYLVYFCHRINQQTTEHVCRHPTQSQICALILHMGHAVGEALLFRMKRQ